MCWGASLDPSVLKDHSDQELQQRLAEEHMYLGDVMHPEDELRAKEAVQRMEARLETICHGTYPETSSHLSFCPKKVPK